MLIINAYLFCGLLYSFYNFFKIFDNKEFFIMTYEEQFGSTDNIEIFLGIMFLTNLFAWPILIINEINNRQDL
jgi:hypothetical protein